VLRVCTAVAGPSDADDAWSETFLAALRAYGDLRPGSDLRAWLVTIAYRKSLDALRRARRRPVPHGTLTDRPAPPPAPGPTWALPSGPLADALAGLAPKQRLAVTARYLADLSYADVAAVLGTTEAAARRNAADGIAALRRCSAAAPASRRTPAVRLPVPASRGRAAARPGESR
jgi:DNA-directed RNA polymerase specialized sigma24 family protein